MIGVLMLALLVSACSSTKHVPDGKYLLDDVKFNISNEGSKKDVKSADLVNYLRQTPNHKVLGGMKLQLAVYNISGKDSTKWFNKWVRRVGNPPVIYDQSLTDASVKQLQTALINKGYMGANVWADTTSRKGKKKMVVTYNVKPGVPHYVSSVAYNIPNDTLRQLILADSAMLLIKKNSVFDRNLLDQERQQISERLREKGYFALNRTCYNFVADTLARDGKVALEYVISEDEQPLKKVKISDVRITYPQNLNVRESVLEGVNLIEPGQPYKESTVSDTYSRFSSRRWVSI